MTDSRQRFKEGATVRVKSLESPFHGWEGIVALATWVDGVLYYKVDMHVSFSRTGSPFRLTFPQGSIEEAKH